MSKKIYYAKKYIRLSYTDDKEVESNSVSNQRDILNDFIAQNSDIVDMGEKVDDGYSGIIFDRPAFKELMEEIKAGEINCVIVKDLSRLGREYIEMGQYLQRIFPAYGVRFIALGDNIDTATSSVEDDMFVTVKNVVNDAYSRDISIKTRSALAVRREHGEYVGAYTVYGYRKSEENKNQLVVDEYPASIVRDIYRMKIDGLSAAAIAEELNRRGVLSPLEYKKDRGLPHAKKGFTDVPDARWSPIAVIRILRDETYTGTLLQGRQTTPNYKVKHLVQKPKSDWVRWDNAHEAIIATGDYDLVQRLSALDTRAAAGEKQVHLFSGLLVCGCCGGRMTRKSIPYKGNRYLYWYCPTGKKNNCKAPVMLKEDVLAECVLESIKGHVSNIASLESLLDAAMTRRAQSKLARQYQMQIEENERQMEKAAATKAGLYALLIDGVLDKAEHDTLKKAYAKDIQNAKAAMETTRTALNKLLSGEDERLAWMKRFQAFGGLTQLDRRTVAHLIQSIRVMGKNELEITFAYQQEFDKAMERLAAPEKGVA